MRALLLTLILMPALASAQIYRWTDADGRVHFGQRPPAGAEQIEVRPQVVERDDQTREREARSERFFDARRQEQQAAREQASQTRAARELERSQAVSASRRRSALSAPCTTVCATESGSSEQAAGTTVAERIAEPPALRQPAKAPLDGHHPVQVGPNRLEPAGPPRCSPARPLPATD